MDDFSRLLLDPEPKKAGMALGSLDPEKGGESSALFFKHMILSLCNILR